MSFATAISCIDGRVHVPLIEYVRSKAVVDYVDVVTEPGAAKLLAENKDSSSVQSIRKRVLLSLEKHASKNIWVAAHHDCAANAAEDEVQIAQISKAVVAVQEWFPGVRVCGLWMDKECSLREIKIF